MSFTRVLDIAVLALVAAALLLPRPGVNVKPAIRSCGEGTRGWCLTEEQRARADELQATLLGQPGEPAASLELANLYLDGKQPDWALAVVQAALDAHPHDHRLLTIKAIAFADRFEPEPAYEAAKRALFECETPAVQGGPPCGDATHARLSLLESTLRSVRGVDMKAAPYLAKERIFESLHPGWIPKPRIGVQGAKAPSTKTPAAP